MDMCAAIHPGEILREEYMAPLGLSANALAIALGIPATRIHAILHEKRGISTDYRPASGPVFRDGYGTVDELAGAV